MTNFFSKNNQKNTCADWFFLLLFARRESPRKTVRRILQAVGVKERRQVSGETRSRESRKTALRISNIAII